MKKITIYVLTTFFLLTLTAFSAHKFYMGIYQINYAPEKKMLEITTRIFVDDLNKVLEKKYKKITHLGTAKETPEDIVLMQKYLSEKFRLKVNGEFEPMNYLSKEIESDVIICYLNIRDIKKVKSLETYNAVLIDLDVEQQNITHFTGLGDKQSYLFTESATNYVLKF
ncbi:MULTISPECIES: DUF6702 family protein [unclassified Flavobacterium]|uniref:DUF6702 family protein n=1 Tax=unclassified Flavobacterium TaxID=196869 RepID=UPI00156F9746|nr:MULTISPECIES: DUF6702 family protein [unclassified Flavobacterium]MBE0392795.1 hypothetical protein [Flavobacterium sp. PL002]NRT13867.1 hypothetical protein [Flavobacterium sp. 28A]